MNRLIMKLFCHQDTKSQRIYVSVQRFKGSTFRVVLAVKSEPLHILVPSALRHSTNSHDFLERNDLFDVSKTMAALISAAVPQGGFIDEDEISPVGKRAGGV
jgi:hypothetical protein